MDWNALGLTFDTDIYDTEVITDAVVVAKASDADGTTSLLIGRTPGLDWITQRGLMSAASYVLDRGEDE